MNVLQNNRLLNNPNQARSSNIHSFNVYDTNLLLVDIYPRRKIGRQLFVPKNESERVILYLLGILTDVWQERGHKVSRKNDHNFL
jgi:hypothetical protein